MPSARQESILNSNTYDDEFQEVFLLKPRRYAVSMLRSQKEAVLRSLREAEERSVASVEAAAVAVSAAKLDFLEASLKADWDQAKLLTGSLHIIADEQHLQKQKWLREQEESAAEAVQYYMKQQLCMNHISNWSVWKEQTFAVALARRKRGRQVW